MNYNYLHHICNTKSKQKKNDSLGYTTKQKPLLIVVLPDRVDKTMYQHDTLERDLKIHGKSV
jgi:hypothetical protein